MKKINWKILNLAFWIEIILAYLLPFKVVDGFQYKVGFPITFIAVYEKSLAVNPFMSMLFNPGGLVLNAFIIYFIIFYVIKGYKKIKHK